MRILTLLVAVTLVGTAATLVALGTLLVPVRLISSALKRYLDDRTKPDLPIGFSDEAGARLAVNYRAMVVIASLMVWLPS